MDVSHQRHETHCATACTTAGRRAARAREHLHAAERAHALPHRVVPRDRLGAAHRPLLPLHVAARICKPLRRRESSRLVE
jgi:hypothetical protein